MADSTPGDSKATFQFILVQTSIEWMDIAVRRVIGGILKSSLSKEH